MTDRRTVDPNEVFVEQRVLDLAETFVTDIHELNRMPEPLRGSMVDRAARMLTAVEVALFDAGPETRQGIACICAVLDEESMEDTGATRVLFAAGEKQEVGGVTTKLLWFTAAEFAEIDLEKID